MIRLIVCFCGIEPALHNTRSCEPQLATVPGARANMEVLETRKVQSTHFDYAHAVTIAIPASYRVTLAATARSLTLLVKRAPQRLWPQPPLGRWERP